MNIYLEVFGYIGTALVLTSMMMTSVVKLRIFNTTGSLISMIYSIICNAWPVVLLNGGLVIINIWQLLRLRKTKATFRHITVGAQDGVLNHFLGECAQDMQTYFPGYRYAPGADTVVHMVLEGTEVVGVMIGTREGATFRAELDYVTQKYRDCSIAAFLLGCLKEEGVEKLVEAKGAAAHHQYLVKMGFRDESGAFVKEL